MAKSIGSFFLFLLFCSTGYAQNLVVQNIPPKPLMGKEFKLVFKYNRFDSNHLHVEFNPGNLRVVRKVANKRPGLLFVEYTVIA